MNGWWFFLICTALCIGIIRDLPRDDLPGRIGMSGFALFYLALTIGALWQLPWGPPVALLLLAWCGWRVGRAAWRTTWHAPSASNRCPDRTPHRLPH